MNRNTYVLGAFSLLVAGAVVFSAADNAHSESAYSTADDIYSGTGWKIFTSNGVLSLNPHTRYVITWDSAAARDKMSKTLEPSLAQLRGIGIDIFNTTLVEKVGATSCAPTGHVVVGMKYRPAGKASTSLGSPCYSTATHAQSSGKVWIDSEYKQLGGTVSLSDRIWKSAVPHEVGHALGLDHPAATKNSAGDSPVMSSPNGGFKASASYSKYTAWDLAGFRQLLENYDD
jgi:hypothetical protein